MSELSNITIPNNVTIIPVDTRNISSKVLLLPLVNENPGRFLIIKDFYGNAAISSFTVSTTGGNLIDYITPTYNFSNSYGTLSLMSDGSNAWTVLDYFNGIFTG